MIGRLDLASARALMIRSVLHVQQVLAWADEHFARTGNWPRKEGGRVHGAPDEKWQNIDQALRTGLRGFPGGWSLPQLLAEYRGARNHSRPPRLTIKKILAWADAHRRSTGQWPRVLSGAIRQAPGETWLAVNLALTSGRRGLPGGSSLAELLAKHRRVRNLHGLPDLSVRQILCWADAYKHRTGRWPTLTSGAIPGTVGETWGRIDKSLRRGTRGIRSQTSLFKLLVKHRGVAKPVYKPPLSEAAVVRWARAYRRRTGNWPTPRSGPIAEAPGESWHGVCNALRFGSRGLRPGRSLKQLCGAAAT